MRAVGRLSDPKEFEHIVIKRTSNGSLIELRDVGRAELGAESYGGQLRYNGQDAMGLGVLQLSNANALQVRRDVQTEMERLAQRFPTGLKYQVAFDTTRAVGESIREVLKTLSEAILIVIIVIFLFLQGWRSTIIPAITIPVSLVGTFIFAKFFGFSINTLTLFGITLATGLVVDDAIVVIENVERHIEEGVRDPSEATRIGMREVTGAVVATSLVLIAVFVPVSLFPGQHRPALPAVCADHRILHCDFRFQRAHAFAGAGGLAVASREGRAKSIFFRHQLGHPQRDYRVPGRAAPFIELAQGGGGGFPCGTGGNISDLSARAHQLCAAGRPGILLCDRAGAAGRVIAVHHQGDGPRRGHGKREP